MNRHPGVLFATLASPFGVSQWCRPTLVNRRSSSSAFDRESLDRCTSQPFGRSWSE